MSRERVALNRQPIADAGSGAGRPGRQAGVSLIEVLITTVVFSVGILGVAGLNAVSKRSSFEAVQRSTAAELAYTLLEDMRGDSSALAVYLAAGTLGGGSLGSEPSPACDSPTPACTDAQLAAHELWVWERMLDSGMELSGAQETGGLASPSACIAGPAGGVAGDYTVTIVWRGVTPLSDPGLDDCGAASGLYGAGNTYRRMVVVRTYIDPAI